LVFYEEGGESNATPSLWAWAKRACLINCQNRNYRSYILKKLEIGGYKLKGAFEDENNASEVKTAVKNSQKQMYSEHCCCIKKKPNPPDERYNQLKEKRELTEDELIERRKGELCRRYATEDIEPDLVKLDDDGMYPKWRLHYLMTLGNIFLGSRERSSLQSLKESGSGQVFKPDFTRKQLSGQIEALKRLEIEQFLDPLAEFTSDSLLEWFEKISTPRVRAQIKTILGVTISPQDTAIAAAQRLLEKLGLKMTKERWQRINGKAKRIYRGCDINPDGRQSIFERWIKRDSQARQSLESDPYCVA
jgi:hypothetical protein